MAVAIEKDIISAKRAGLRILFWPTKEWKQLGEYIAHFGRELKNGFEYKGIKHYRIQNYRMAFKRFLQS